MRKPYYIPTIEIITLNTERLMSLGDTSNHIGGGDNGAPKRRRTPVF